MSPAGAAKRLAFTQYESEVHAQLSALILDAANMHAIFAQAFRIQGGALSSVAQSGAPHLTHQQMTGAPNATYAIEHHTHAQPLGGEPVQLRPDIPEPLLINGNDGCVEMDRSPAAAVAACQGDFAR